MNRNQQLRNYRCNGCSFSDAVVETPSLVGGKVVFSVSKADEHFAQFDPKAFSLQSIAEAGLIDQLRESSSLPSDSLDVLDGFNSSIRSNNIVNPVKNESTETSIVETDN